MNVNLSALLGQSAFWLINKALAKIIGRDEAFLLSDLISKYEYFESQGKLTEIEDKQYMFMTYESIENDTLFSKYEQRKIIANLINMGFVSKVSSGMPRKTFYHIDKMAVASVFTCREESERHVVKKVNDMSLNSSILDENIPYYIYNNKYKNNISCDFIFEDKFKDNKDNITCDSFVKDKNNKNNENNITCETKTETKTKTEKDKKFELFWELYGKKIDRFGSQKKFMKLTNKDIELILVHVPKYVASTPDVQYRKNPKTYLNNKGWLDEIVVSEQTRYSKWD